MREIKFRVWDNVDYMSTPFILNDITSKISFVEGLPIMQYTGLRDRNGKEIYEADVIQLFEKDEWCDGVHSNIYQVEWGNDYPAFTLKGYEDIEYNSLQHAVLVAECEVIGNIYQNPELLKP